MKNNIGYDIHRLDGGNGIENTYLLQFETPMGLIENVSFKATEDNLSNAAIKCLGDCLVILAEVFEGK